jgi:hypothetical protein
MPPVRAVYQAVFFIQHDRFGRGRANIEPHMQQRHARPPYIQKLQKGFAL